MVLQAYPEDLLAKQESPKQDKTYIVKYYYSTQSYDNHYYTPLFFLALVSIVAITGIVIYALSKK